MRFVQYLFPDGRKREEVIEMPPEIERKAQALEAAGWQFEIECFPDTQMVHMDCSNEERVLANRVVRNGPQVPIKVEELVNEAAAAGGIQ